MPTMPSISSIESLSELSELSELRGQLENLVKEFKPLGMPIEIPTRAGRCKALLYRPDAPGPSPVLFNLHGGGFVIGSPAQNDAICHSISRTLGIVVVSPAYRLAPEHPYPAALDDVYDVATYVAAHPDEFGADPERLAIAGHSAGGNLAAACCLLAARERSLSFRCCILDYAHLNVDGPAPDAKVDSKVLSPKVVGFFNSAYRGDHSAKDPLVSPVFATDAELADFPPCLVITPEHGPYRDDDEAFAKRLVEAGDEVLNRRFLGVDHGFTEMHFRVPRDTDEASIAAAEEAVELMIWELRRHLEVGPIR